MNKVGITFSTFDLLHAGHIMMLEEAKTQCDWLVVALQSDPTVDRPDKNKPIQTMYERYIQLKGCRYVDEVVPYTIRHLRVDLTKKNSLILSERFK
jgi:glycerol-3-phosphate cytidylyltransferase